MPEPQAQIPTCAEATNQVSSQESGNLSVVKHDDGGLRPYKATDALQEIGSSGMRGQALFLALSPVIKILQDQLAASQQRVALLEQRLEALQLKLNEKSELCAVQKNELDNAKKLKLAQNILLTAGGIANGIAGKFLIDGKPVGWAWLTFGVILLFVGWLWPLGSKSK